MDNITIKGESSAGKNYLLQSILETEPTEDVVMLTGMTPKALQYANVTLRHKLIAIAEALGAQDADYSIRTFQSEKVITIWTVEKDDSGRMVTREHKVEGPAAFFLTTTKAHFYTRKTKQDTSISSWMSPKIRPKEFSKRKTDYTSNLWSKRRGTGF